MELGTILATTGFIAAGNYAVWGLKSGNGIYNAVAFGSKTYDSYLRPTVERLLGIGRNVVLMTSSKPTSTKDYQRFTFNNVSVVDFDKIQNRLSEAKQKVNLKIREAELRESKPYIGEDQKGINYYEINLTAKESGEVHLGRIDDPNWSLSNIFDIIITREGSNSGPVGIDSDEYKQVLATLDRSSKVVLDLPLISEEKIRKEITAAIGGDKFVEDWGHYLNDYRAKQTISLEDEQNPTLGSTAYISNLINSALEKSIDNPSAIFDDYSQKIEKEINKEIAVANKTIPMLEEEVKKREQRRLKNRVIAIAGTISSLIITPTVIAVLVAIAILAVVASVALSIFLPGIGSAASAAISGAIQAVGAKIINFFSEQVVTNFLNLGTASIALGLFTKARREYRIKKRAEKEAKKELKDILNSKKELVDNLENLKLLKTGANKTLESIRNFIESPNQDKILDISNKEIGDIGAVISCVYSSKTDGVKTLILSNNGITVTGAKEIGIAIENMQTTSAEQDSYLHTIDLMGNPIGIQGVEALRNALKNNFTITTLKHDYPDEETDKQLLINWYLQGNDCSETVVNGLFGSLKLLETTAMAKLENNFNITSFPPSKNVEVSKSAQRITQQNIYLQQLSPLLSKLEQSSDQEPASDVYKEIVEAASKAFEIDTRSNSNRCYTFLKKSKHMKIISAKREALAKTSDLD
ncbi:MAG: hypothetical protein KKE11_04605, partial [Gammaproteobacteria bacterium]|nr:hypothetical protein [Gammaproteobacteria bacterium]